MLLFSLYQIIIIISILYNDLGNKASSNHNHIGLVKVVTIVTNQATYTTNYTMDSEWQPIAVYNGNWTARPYMSFILVWDSGMKKYLIYSIENPAAGSAQAGNGGILSNNNNNSNRQINIILMKVK